MRGQLAAGRMTLFTGAGTLYYPSIVPAISKLAPALHNARS